MNRDIEGYLDQINDINKFVNQIGYEKNLIKFKGILTSFFIEYLNTNKSQKKINNFVKNVNQITKYDNFQFPKDTTKVSTIKFLQFLTIKDFTKCTLEELLVGFNFYIEYSKETYVIPGGTSSGIYERLGKF